MLYFAPAVDALKEHARAAGVQDSALHDLDDIGFEEYQQTDFMPFDPAVKRTQATIKTKDNTVFKVTKGAPDVIIALCPDQQDGAKATQVPAPPNTYVINQPINAATVVGSYVLF